MTWQELLNKWKKTGDYTKELTFICSEVKRKTPLETIAALYAITKEDLLEMAKADPMVDMALKRKNIVARKYHQEQCYMYAYGYTNKEPREYDYMDNKGVQQKKVYYIPKWYPGTFQDREYYGRVYVDESLDANIAERKFKLKYKKETGDEWETPKKKQWKSLQKSI